MRIHAHLHQQKMQPKKQLNGSRQIAILKLEILQQSTCIMGEPVLPSERTCSTRLGLSSVNSMRRPSCRFTRRGNASSLPPRLHPQQSGKCSLTPQLQTPVASFTPSDSPPQNKKARTKTILEALQLGLFLPNRRTEFPTSLKAAPCNQLRGLQPSCDIKARVSKTKPDLRVPMDWDMRNMPCAVTPKMDKTWALKQVGWIWS